MRLYPEDFTYTLFLVTMDYFINDRNQWAPKKPPTTIVRANLPKLPPGGRLYSLSKIGKELYFTDINARDLPRKKVFTDNFLQILLQIWQGDAYLSHGEPKCYSPFKSIVDHWLTDPLLQSLIAQRKEQFIQFLPMLYPAVLQIIAEYVIEETEVSLALGTTIALFKQVKQSQLRGETPLLNDLHKLYCPVNLG